MLESNILQFLKSHSNWAPLWVEKSALACHVLFVADVLSTREEKDLFQKISKSMELGSEEVQALSQHWTLEALNELILRKRPRFVVGFGPIVEELFLKAHPHLKEKSEGWKRVSESSAEYSILLAPDLVHLKVDAEAKKNLWSALKIAKAQLGKA